MRGIIFPTLPLNTDRNYVRGIAKDGCEIWIPVIDGSDLQKAKTELEIFLNNQPIDEEPKELA